MRVLIIGSGATGGFIGARLIEKKIDVTFLTRTSRKVQLVTRGLHLSSQFGRFRQPVSAITPDELSGPYDLIVVATRAHRYEASLLLAAPAIGRDTILMPMVEGARHLVYVPGEAGPRMIGAVLEGRILLDADGALIQRPPVAELHIGALRTDDEPLARKLVEMFNARGLKAIESPRIRSQCWERFSFVAAGIATAFLKQRPLRDAVRFVHGPGYLQDMLKEGYAIGSAAGFAPDMTRIGKYERAFWLAGRPVAEPAQLSDDGSAGDEAGFLLAQMIGFARHAGARANLFNRTWEEVMSPKAATAWNRPTASSEV